MKIKLPLLLINIFILCAASHAQTPPHDNFYLSDHQTCSIAKIPYDDCMGIKNKYYYCQTDQSTGENYYVNIWLRHTRTTEAQIKVFGQTFHGFGNFLEKIIVTDRTATYYEPKTIHIPFKSPNGSPFVMYVFTAQDRAPKAYKLKCKSNLSSKTDFEQEHPSSEKSSLIPPKFGECGGPRTKC